MDTHTIDRKGILAYLLITFGITYAIELALILPGFRADGVPQFLGQLVIAGVMWVPALATLLTIKLVTHEPLRSLNLRFGPLRPYLTAALVVPATYALIYGLTWLLGLGQPDWQMNALRSLLTGAGADSSTLPQPAVFWPILFLVSSLVAPFINSIFGLGEEIGWRGFLVPELAKVTNFAGVALISGAMWAVYHFPVLIFADYNAGTPVWFGLGCFTLGVIAESFIYAWLTLRSGSLWPAAFLHGSHNLWVQSILTPLTRDTGPTKYIIDEFGIGLVITCVVAAIIVWCKRGQLPSAAGRE